MSVIDSIKIPNGNEYDVMAKLGTATDGNIASYDENGNIEDSGVAVNDVVTKVTATENNFASFDENGKPKDSGKKASDFEPALDLTSETETGNPITFTTDSAQVAQNTVITFTPTQAGSGDPSPLNPRAISGVSSVTIDVANGDDPTDPDYEALPTVTISLNETLYGGTLDVESGKLVVDKKGITKKLSDRDSESAINSFTRYAFFSTITDALGESNEDICSIAPMVVSYDGESTHFYINRGAENYLFITVPNSTPNTTEFTIVYKLATPITIQLPPAQVKLLQGANVVTTNGTSMSLTYRNGEVAKLSDLSGLADAINGLSGEKADNSIVASVELTNVSQNHYYKSAHFINKDGKFCRALAEINVGDTISLGTNCVATTLEDFNQYHAGDAILFGGQSDGFVGVYTSSGKIRTYVKMAKKLGADVNSATASISYAEIWGQGLDYNFMSYVTSITTTLYGNTEGLTIDFDGDFSSLNLPMNHAYAIILGGSLIFA